MYYSYLNLDWSEMLRFGKDITKRCPTEEVFYT